mgnify:CR=1 FL=1
MPFFRYFALLALLLTPSVSASEDKTSKHITFACSESTDSPLFSMLQIVFSYYFDSQGYSFSMQTTTEQRMISEVSSGRIDGSCGQNIPMFEALNDSRLLRTTTPIADLSVRALSRKQSTTVQSLEDLLDPTLRIGIIASTGTALAAKDLGIKYSNILNIDRGARMLAANRLDYVVSNHLQIMRAVNDLGSQTPMQVSDSLFHLSVHPIFNRVHLPFIPSMNLYLAQLNQCLGGPLSQVTSRQWFNLSKHTIAGCIDRKRPAVMAPEP